MISRLEAFKELEACWFVYKHVHHWLTTDDQAVVARLLSDLEEALEEGKKIGDGTEGVGGCSSG